MSTRATSSRTPIGAPRRSRSAVATKAHQVRLGASEALDPRIGHRALSQNRLCKCCKPSGWASASHQHRLLTAWPASPPVESAADPVGDGLRGDLAGLIRHLRGSREERSCCRTRSADPGRRGDPPPLDKDRGLSPLPLCRVLAVAASAREAPPVAGIAAIPTAMLPARNSPERCL